MPKKPIEAHHEDGQWKSRRQGNGHAFSAGGNEAEQTAEGRAAARRGGVEHSL